MSSIEFSIEEFDAGERVLRTLVDLVVEVRTTTQPGVGRDVIVRDVVGRERDGLLSLVVQEWDPEADSTIGGRVTIPWDNIAKIHIY